MSGGSFLKADWPAPANIVAGTTLRNGGVSEGVYASLNLGAHVGDRALAVGENRQRVAERLRLPGEPYWLRQVHGHRVVRAPFGDAEPEADACLTGETGVVCAVLTADCLPVLFCSADGSAVGAAHAGWRGLSAGVLEAVIAAFDCDPGSLTAWLGPAISQPSFEVGAEVRREFVDHDAAAARHFERNAAGRWQADLYGLARQRLESSGLKAIYGGGRCTYRETDAFYSYRRNGECGRMASLIFRRDEA